MKYIAMCLAIILASVGGILAYRLSTLPRKADSNEPEAALPSKELLAEVSRQKSYLDQLRKSNAAASAEHARSVQQAEKRRLETPNGPEAMLLSAALRQKVEDSVFPIVKQKYARLLAPLSLDPARLSLLLKLLVLRDYGSDPDLGQPLVGSYLSMISNPAVSPQEIDRQIKALLGNDSADTFEKFSQQARITEIVLELRATAAVAAQGLSKEQVGYIEDCIARHSDTVGKANFSEPDLASIEKEVSPMISAEQLGLLVDALRRSRLAAAVGTLKNQR